ncbi:MAG: alpha/beta fold hydrolase [Solirubrobacteraceae bacterium]
MALSFDRRGSGEPLVLLHGIGSRWQAFLPVLPTLAERFEVWSLDLPGFGASPPPSRPIGSIADLTDQVAGWMAEQGIEGAHVAGNSTGGAVALELAARGLAASACALAPIGFWSTRERAFCQASLRGTRAFARASRPLVPLLAAHPATRTLSLAQYYAKPWRLSPGEVAGGIDALLGATAFDAVDAAFTGYLAPADAADHVPVTIAWGAKDRLLLPRQLDRARRRLPRARHVLIPDAGHLMMSDQPVAVAAVMVAAGAAAAAAG